MFISLIKSLYQYLTVQLRALARIMTSTISQATYCYRLEPQLQESISPSTLTFPGLHSIGEALKTYECVDTSDYQPSSPSEHDLRDIDWADIYAVTHSHQKRLSAEVLEYYYLLLKTAVESWTDKDYETVHETCQYALGNSNKLDYFTLFCFTALDLAVYYDDPREAKNVLNFYIKVSRSTPGITYWQQKCLYWLRQIVGKPDMEQEMRACLGMRQVKARKGSKAQKESQSERNFSNLRKRVNVRSGVSPLSPVIA